jgi:cation diffusion facilitator family transporter
VDERQRADGSGAEGLPRAELLRRGLGLEYLTIGWNVFEGLVAIGAGLASGSVALVAFGLDSLVETTSGVILVWRLGVEQAGADAERVEQVERRAERLVGIAFLVLATYVAFESVRTLLAAEAPEASPVGIALIAVSLALMLWLARAKRRVGEALGSRALIADSEQTRACWYLSVVTLAGLVANALLGWWWADSLAALAIAVLLVREGLEAIRGSGDDQDEVAAD